jgi:hypothetical protein
VLRKDSTLREEALEAFYKINTFKLNLPSDPQSNFSDAWGSNPHSKMHIRHLIVSCNECCSSFSDFHGYEQKLWAYYPRQRWAQFLEMPHLQSLTINMQKACEGNIFTLDFSPVIYHLRTLRPSLTLTFNISFDAITEYLWKDPREEYANFHLAVSSMYNYDIYDNSDPAHYEFMGFIDVSDLIMPPTEEDKSYVAEYLADRRMPPAISIEQGLLSETPANRRVLGKHYVVKEPALLRVLMQEHYEVYLKYDKERKEQAADVTRTA